jgi:hypothetical protein
MPHQIELPDELFALLQKHAIPLIDTPLTVIERALRALEAGDEEPLKPNFGSGTRSFNPAAPPDLSFTSLKSAKIAGRVIRRAELFWNTVLMETILEAAQRGSSTQDILYLITVNHHEGRREDGGFKYLEAAGLSIQGQAANSAWRQTYVLASSFGIELEIAFSWQDTPKAAQPNQMGTFFVEGA